MGQDEVRALYEATWKEPYPYRFPAQASRPPLDEQLLRDRWDAEKAKLVETLAQSRMPVKGVLASPHLDALEGYLILSWQELDEPDTFHEALSFVAEIEEPLAVVVAYEELRVALELAGSKRFLKPLADDEKRYMRASDGWHEFLEQVKRGNHPTPRVPDSIPGGLPEPQDPEQPLDEPDESTVWRDPFSD